MYAAFGAVAITEQQLAAISGGAVNCGSILVVQKTLNELGFDPGPLDGIYGPKTEAACKAFAASVGIAYVKPPKGEFCVALAKAYLKHQGVVDFPATTSIPIPGSSSPSLPSLPAINVNVPSWLPGASAPTAPPPAPAPAAAEGGSGVIAWWGKQTTTTKVGIGVAAGVGALVLVKALRG